MLIEENWHKNFLSSASLQRSQMLSMLCSFGLKCNAKLTSESVMCILRARIFSIILVSSWAFLLLHSSFPYLFILLLFPFPSQALPYASWTPKSMVKGVLTAFCSAVSITKATEDGQDSWTKNLAQSLHSWACVGIYVDVVRKGVVCI